MAVLPRHFTNRLPDYNGTLRLMQPEVIRDKCLELATQILKMNRRETEGGIYVGIAGVAYALCHMAQSQHFLPESKNLLLEAKCRIENHISIASRHAVNRPFDDIGYMLGGTGVYTVGALLAAAIGDQSGISACLQLITRNIELVVAQPPVADFLKCGSDELMIGRAGVLCALCVLRRNLQTPVVHDSIVIELCRALVYSGRHHAKAKRTPCPLMYSYHGTEYLGAAHGLAGVLQMLLAFPQCLRAVDSQAETDVRTCVDWLAARQQLNGNWPVATDELARKEKPEREQLVHWCHGAPGIIYLMATAYMQWNEPRYLKACVRAGDIIWRRGLLSKGPGLCHGVAGNAYALLLIYRLTGDSQWLHRAHQFMSFADSAEFRDNARTPDAPLSLYEGLAGTLCCYVDLLQPQNAELPLYPVPGFQIELKFL